MLGIICSFPLNIVEMARPALIRENFEALFYFKLIAGFLHKEMV